MGINNFWNIENNKGQKLKETIKKIKLKKIQNKILIIDANNILYQILSIHNKLKEKFSDDFLSRILNQKLKKYVKNANKMIWVFDSPEKNALKIKKEGKIKFTDEQFSVCLEILKKRDDIKILFAPFGQEAEKICAKIENKIGENAIVVSDDTDALIFGTRKLLMRKMRYIELKDILDFLSLKSRKDLILISLALGSDFNKKIKGITAKNVIKKYNNGDIKYNKNMLKIANYFF